ncbi:MAG: hypothetical protein PHO15_08545, partial [Eubacteriales bacterium]|nr:hypothetical protein [Eubacteriales bacterium]
MHKVFLLAKTMLKSGGGMFANKSGKIKWWLPVVLLFAFSSFILSMVMMTFNLYDMLGGAADAILPLAFGATSIVIFFFGIFYVVSTMYHADDIEILMGLPLCTYHILGAKFLTLVVYEYIIEAFVLLPILVAFAIKSGAGILFCVYTAVLFVITPVIALAMSSVIVIIVMRFTNFGKNKQAFKFIGGILAIVLAIGLNVVIQRSVRNVSPEQIMAIMTGDASVVALFSNMFPGIVFAANTLVYSHTIDGLLNLMMFILCSAAAVAVFLGIGQLFYLKGAAGVTETAAKRKGIADLGKTTAGMPVTRAYVKKEIRLLFRSPIAFLNCVLMNFIWPVLVIVMLFSSGQSIDQVSGIISGIDDGLLVAIIVGASAFLSSANAITSTAISREGKTLYFTKYIPVPMEKQLKAKTMAGMIFSGASVVVLVIICVFLGVDIWVALTSLLISLAAMIAASMAGLLIDVANPKLNWMNEQQAIKQNVNVLLHMLFGLVMAAAAIVPVLLIVMSEAVAVIYTAALFVLLAVV